MSLPPSDKANETPPVNVGFLIFPGFPMACLTSAIEPLRGANEIVGRTAFTWKIIADQEGPIQSSAGVSFAPDLMLNDAENFQHLFMISSPDGRMSAPAKANAVLQRHLREGGSLGGFSGGIFPLARSGLVQGKPMSVHWCYEAAFQAEFPEIEAQQTVLIEHGHCKTASGSGAVFDLMLNLIEEELGAAVTTETACWFQHPYVRGANIPQRLPVLGNAAEKNMLPPKVAQAIKIFSENIENPIQISAVADEINMSSRSLERSFKRATGESPLKYYRKMRMSEARQLVLYSRDPITSIGYMVGYSSPSAFQRHYREVHGLSPHKDREAKNSLRVIDGSCLPTM